MLIRVVSWSIVVGQRRARRTIARVYDQQVYEALERIWYLYGGMCGKRLIVRNQLPLLEKFDEISLDATVREKLQSISAASTGCSSCRCAVARTPSRPPAAA